MIPGSSGVEVSPFIVGIGFEQTLAVNFSCAMIVCSRAK